MMPMKLKQARRERRELRVRKKIVGTMQRPRLVVARSNQNIQAQIVDDVSGRTLCAASSVSKDLRGQVSYGGNVKAAEIVGQKIGEKARSMGIELVAFDRRGHRYHGRIKALADAARKNGLKF